MTRQDFNQALLQTSFLYGANAAYIEELQAQYEKDPASVEAGWREFFAALGDDPASVEKTAQGASWQKANWPVAPKGDLISALDGDWPAAERIVGEKLRAKAPPAADARKRARPDDDPRLPHARASARQSRSARPRSAEGSRGAASLELRLLGSRLRSSHFHRQCPRAGICDHPRNARHPAAHLLRHDRL